MNKNVLAAGLITLLISFSGLSQASNKHRVNANTAKHSSHQQHSNRTERHEHYNSNHDCQQYQNHDSHGYSISHKNYYGRYYGYYNNRGNYYAHNHSCRPQQTVISSTVVEMNYRNNNNGRFVAANILAVKLPSNKPLNRL